MKKKINKVAGEIMLPTTSQLEKELEREKYKLRYNKLLTNCFQTIIIVVALSVLISSLIFPVLRIHGKSMEPNLKQGDIVVSVKKSNFKSGDVIAFYYNNNILVKRIIATPSQWVNIDEKGNVYVDDKLLIEPYIEEISYGESNVKFPYQVPEETYFVLGDDRKNSIDSRNSTIGTISKDEIIGKVIFRVWPINRFGISR